jgi:hypothetical protein
MTVTTPATSQRPESESIANPRIVPIIIPEEKLKKLKDDLASNNGDIFKQKDFIEFQEHVWYVDQYLTISLFMVMMLHRK